MTKYLNGYKEFINAIDFNDLLDCVINNDDYDSIYERTGIKRKNLLEYEYYKKYDNFIKDQLKLISSSTPVLTDEQSKTNDSFFHVAINRNFGNNKFRIYLSPSDENLYPLINEILKRSYKTDREIYLKYNRDNRLDKIIVYLQDINDLLDKLQLIEEIKKDYPQYFVNMKKSSFWISPSKIDGVYISPEAHIQRIDGGAFPSFGILVNVLINQMKEYLYFCLNELDDEKTVPLKKYSKSYLMTLFKPICQRMIAMYGAFIYQEGNDINMFYSDEFQGLAMPVNERVKFNRDTKKLEVLKRYDNSFVVYEVPIGSSIIDDYENSNYVSYDIKNVNNYIFYGLDYVLKNGEATKRIRYK